MPPAEPLDATGGTLRFHGTPVEKQCSTVFLVLLLILSVSVCFGDKRFVEPMLELHGLEDS